MPSLYQQNGNWYSQFYDSDRSPQRKRIPLKVATEEAAQRLHYRAVDAYALGEYDPWTDGREHEVFGWSPPPEDDLADLVDARQAFLEEKRRSCQPATVADTTTPSGFSYQRWIVPKSSPGAS